MSPRMGTLTTSITLRTFQEAVEKARWREHVRFLYGEGAERVMARADELSTTTAMDRVRAREQAESEMRDQLAQALRALAEDVDKGPDRGPDAPTEATSERE